MALSRIPFYWITKLVLVLYESYGMPKYNKLRTPYYKDQNKSWFKNDADTFCE